MLLLYLVHNHGKQFHVTDYIIILSPYTV